MSHSELSEVQSQNLLDAITQSVLTGHLDLDPLLDRYDVEPEEITGFVQIISRLEHTYEPCEPSEKFCATLKQELLGNMDESRFAHLRKFPIRAQIAAGVAAIAAGFLFVSRRKPPADDNGEVDIPLLQR
jgi:hypothetical protein